MALSAVRDIGIVNEKKNPSLSLLEKLLYGYDFEKDNNSGKIQKREYEYHFWIQRWREYVGIDGNIGSEWRFEQPLQKWEQVELILNNLEKLKKEDEELFKRVVTADFISALLYEIAKTRVVFLAHNQDKKKNNLKYLQKWIKMHVTANISCENFWRCIQTKMVSIHELTVDYSRQWKACCGKPIYISIDKSIGKDYFLSVMSDTCFYDEDLLNYLLDICDGVIGNKFQNSNCMNHILETENKELLYRCLKKNFLNKEDARCAVVKAQHFKNYEAIPLLMLKSYGEWEEKVLD